MSKVRFTTLAACIVSAAIGYSANAQAAIVFNTSLGAPGVYYGSGNPNGNFTVTTETFIGVNTIEVGQRAIERYVGAIAPSSTNIYNVSTGPTSVPGKTGSDWGFVFSVNLGTTGLVLNDVVPLLTLTDVGTGGGGLPFNLFLIPDNGHILGAGGTQNDCSLAAVCNNAVDKGFQNSEALEFTSAADFATFLGDAAYNVNANDTYYFRLDLFGSNTCPFEGCAGTLLATNTIEVIAAGEGVPEPTTLALFGAGLMGIGLIGRRKQKKT